MKKKIQINNGSNKTKKSKKKRFRSLGEKENYKYLLILETGTIKQTEMKNDKERALSRTRRLVETQRCTINLIQGLNTGKYSL